MIGKVVSLTALLFTWGVMGFSLSRGTEQLIFDWDSRKSFELIGCSEVRNVGLLIDIFINYKITLRQ